MVTKLSPRHLPRSVRLLILSFTFIVLVGVALIPFLRLTPKAHAAFVAVATIPVGSAPWGIDVNPTTNRIYVANAGSNTVSVIDGSTNTVVATIPVTSPDGVGVNPVTNRIYVDNGSYPNQMVSVIDGSTNTVAATIPVPGRFLIASRGIAVNSVTNLIYVPSFDPGGAIVRIDGATNTYSLIGVAPNPLSAAVDPVTNRIYVGYGSFFGRTQISVIDGASNAVSDCAAVGLSQTSIGVNPSNGRVYVHKGDPSRGEPFGVVAVDGPSCGVLGSIPVGTGEGGTRVDPTSNRIYVANYSSNGVSVIDGSANAVVTTVSLAGPGGVAVNPTTGLVYVSQSVSNTVAVLLNDTSPPVITITTPTATTYLLNQSVLASYSCTDSDSAVASCAGPVASGAPIDTASVGTKTFTVQASDPAGNTASQSVTFSVGYAICLLYDPTKAVKSGSAIPIKVALCDANGADVSSSSLVVTAVSVTQISTNAPVTLTSSGNANPGNTFRFDATLGTAGGYIFNLSTKGFAPGTYALSFTAGSDPTLHTVQFEVS